MSYHLPFSAQLSVKLLNYLFIMAAAEACTAAVGASIPVATLFASLIGSLVSVVIERLALAWATETVVITVLT